MQRQPGQGRTAFPYGGEQRLGTAAVHARPRRRRGQQRVDVEQAALVLRMDRDTLAVGRQFGQERHGRPGPAAVGQPPAALVALGLGEHGQQRGDADAARDEQQVVGGQQREAVARADCPQPHPLDHLVVQLRRPAAPAGLAQHGDAPGAGPVVPGAQGVLAHEPGGQHQIDMGSRRRGGQCAAVGGHELQAHHARGEFAAFADHHLERAVGHVLLPPLRGSSPAVRRPATG